MNLRSLARASLVGCVLAGASAFASTPVFATTGLASFYGPEATHPTANGEQFIPDSKPGQHTCASWHYPFNTRLRVTDAATGKSVVCRINDRGPAKRLHRLVDLSRGAGKELGILSRGVVRAHVAVVGHAKGPRRRRP